MTRNDVIVDLEWAFVNAGLCSWDARTVTRPHPWRFAQVAADYFAQKDRDEWSSPAGDDEYLTPMQARELTIERDLLYGHATRCRALLTEARDVFQNVLWGDGTPADLPIRIDMLLQHDESYQRSEDGIQEGKEGASDSGASGPSGPVGGSIPSPPPSKTVGFGMWCMRCGQWLPQDHTPVTRK